jgi:DNA-binding response OmpR family regulator
MQILLLEDNGDHAQLVIEAMHDHEVVVAQSLAEALDSPALATCDVVICDLSLPDADGTEGVRALAERLTTTPILVLTTNEDEATEAETLLAGAQEFLPKIDVLLHESLTRLSIEQAARHGIQRQRRVHELTSGASEPPSE